MDSPNGRLPLGCYPTPVEPIPALSTTGSRLWVKRDDLTHPACGGNKVRKLEYLLSRARAAGARRLVTIGAAGSHHVLSTAYFGTRAGFEVEAVLVPQPRTDHAVEVLRASLGLGVRAFACRTWGAACLTLASRIAAGSHLIPLGGSSVVGTGGYFHAAEELAKQVTAGELPEPDVCVVALGSGGTAAGLAAGFAALRMKTRVVGVVVARPAPACVWMARRLTRACLRVQGAGGGASGGRVVADERFLGRGYGHPTPAGEQAMREAAAEARLVLDPTYTAKAFAAALWQVRARQAPRVLYWHTLSSAPIRPLIPDTEPGPEADRLLAMLLAPAPAP